ncbi:autotransporter domain-containing protein [Xanthobacteraceae bacterium A53D]
MQRLGMIRRAGSRMGKGRAAATLGLVLSGGLAIGGAHAAPLPPWSLYDGYSQSYTLTYDRNLASALAGSAATHDNTLTLDVTINGQAVTPTLDTGSTGFVISSALIKLDDPTSGTPGWVFYNSTGLLVTGYFHEQVITFENAVDQNGSAATVTSKVPVLVVTDAQCLGVGANSKHCNRDTAITSSLMLGVGFDRNTMGSGTVAQGDPSAMAKLLNNAPTTSQAYNPFLHVAGMGDGDLRRGYIVTPTGVELGLTTANTTQQAYGYGQLVLKGESSDTTIKNWQAVQATVTAGKYSGTGTLLMDTGVTDSFIGIPGAPLAPAHDGIRVDIELAGGIAGYKFVVGDSTNPQTPSPVSFFHPAAQFVNSSLHTYAGFNVLFDAEGGFIGMALNGYSGNTHATVTPLIAATGTLALTEDFGTLMHVVLVDDSTISTTHRATFDGDIMGDGSLTLSGGTIHLNGAVFHTGGTTVLKGITELNGTLAGSLTIASAATFHDAHGGYNVAAGQVLANAGSFTAPGSVTLSNAGTVVNTGTISANFANSGTVLNSGTFSANVINTGSFTNNGTVTGHFENAGTLSGNGTYASMLVRSGAVVAPGNSIGVHMLAGDATFEPGSVLLMELDAPGVSDQLLVGGTLTAGGASLTLMPGAGFVPVLGARYQLVTAGSIASDFSVATTYFGARGSVYPFLAGTLDGTGGLTLARSSVSFAALGATGNARAAGRAADTLAASHALAGSLATLSARAAPAALGSLSGEIHATAQSTLQAQSSYVRGAVMGRLEQAGAGTPGTAQTVALDGRGTTLWAQAYGGWGTSGGDGTATAASRSIGGFLIGLDGMVSDWRLGLAAGFGQSDFSTDLPGSGGSDNYDLALYASRSFAVDGGALNLRLGAAYGWHDISVSRTVSLPGQARPYTSNYAGGTAQAFGELGYEMPVAGAPMPLKLEPFAGLAYAALSTNGFSESFGTAALIGQGASFDTLYSTLGLKARAEIGAGSALPFAVTGTLGWQHAYGDVATATTLAFATGGVPFTVAGAPLARDALLVGAGLGTKLGEAVDVSVAYSGQLASGFTEQAVKGSFNWRF